MDIKNIIHFNGQLYTKDEQEWFNGYRRVPVTTATPTFLWKGPRMSIAEWRKAMCFLLRVNKLTKSEAQLRAFVVDGEIICWAFPQKKNSGMTTKEISGPEKDAQMLDISNRGGVQIMTIHSHCNMSAFQSGTDKADEDTVDGLHITVGKLDNTSEYDLHARIYYDRCEYGAGALNNWFDIGLTEEMQREITTLFGPQESLLTKMALCAAITEQDYMAPNAFPQKWWDNLIPDVPITYHQSAQSGHYRYSGPVRTTHPYDISGYAGMSRCTRIPGRGLNATERISIMSIAADIFGRYPAITMERMLETLRRKNGPAKEDVYAEDFVEFYKKIKTWGYTRGDAIQAVAQSMNEPVPTAQPQSQLPFQSSPVAVDTVANEQTEEMMWDAYVAQNYAGRFNS